MKNLRTNVLKESIADFTNIANSIKENTSATVQALLRDAVAQEYVKIMSEGFDKDEEEEEVDVETPQDESEEDIEINDTEAEDTSVDSETPDDVEGEESDFENDEELEMESTPQDWEEFDDYKMDNGQYDFTKADDDTIVKVYKLLKNSDEVVVDMDCEKNKLELKDNQTGAEYLIDLDSVSCGDNCEDGSCEVEFEMDDDIDAYGDEDLENNNVKESRMVEIVLSESTDLGYTDNYQDDDVISGLNMDEPSKQYNDWDAGVPKGTKKPWAGKGTPKKGKPFCEEDEMDDEMALEDVNYGSDFDDMGFEGAGFDGMDFDDDVPRKPRKGRLDGTDGKGNIVNGPRWMEFQRRKQVNQRLGEIVYPEVENFEASEGDELEECNVPTKKVNDWGLNHTPKKGNKVAVKNASNWGLAEEIDECGTMDEEDFIEGDDIEEATNVGGAVQQRSMSKSHIPSGRKQYGPYAKHHVSANGQYSDSVTEAMKRKHEQIVAENKKMKKALNNLHSLVKEAAVTNMNLGQIVKLLNENSTTQDEKREIIARFGKEAKTIKESKELYAKISRELQKKNVMNINEEKQFTAENSKKINENTIYASKDLMASLDLMHKICK